MIHSFIIKTVSFLVVWSDLDLRVYLSEDKQTLLDLVKLDDYNKRKLNDPNTYIFKSFFHIDSSLRALKKLYEEPERLKLWDPNIQQTKLISYLSANNSKIFSKRSKPLESITK